MTLKGLQLRRFLLILDNGKYTPTVDSYINKQRDRCILLLNTFPFAKVFLFDIFWICNTYNYIRKQLIKRYFFYCYTSFRSSLTFRYSSVPNVHLWFVLFVFTCGGFVTCWLYCENQFWRYLMLNFKYLYRALYIFMNYSFKQVIDI